jgi:hypothetical protein
MGEKKHKVVTVRGNIFPVKWDENNHVIRGVIDTVEQDEYFIETTKKGKELFRFLNRKVEVTGTLKEDAGGDFVISVSAYTLLDQGGAGNRING